MSFLPQSHLFIFYFINVVFYGYFVCNENISSYEYCKDCDSSQIIIKNFYLFMENKISSQPDMTRTFTSMVEDLWERGGGKRLKIF